MQPGLQLRAWILCLLVAAFSVVVAILAVDVACAVHLASMLFNGIVQEGNPSSHRQTERHRDHILVKTEGFTELSPRSDEDVYVSRRPSAEMT